MSPDRRSGWTKTSGPAASARSLLKKVGGSSVSRSRWRFRLRWGSPTSGRSKTCSSCRRTDGSELVAPFSPPSERRRSRRERCGWRCRPRTTTTPLSVSKQTAASPDQGLVPADAAARAGTSLAGVIGRVARGQVDSLHPSAARAQQAARDPGAPGGVSVQPRRG